MNLRIIVVIIVTLLISTSSVHAQVPDAPMILGGFVDPTQMPNTVNCFDYYSFGSVSVEFTSNVTKAVAGTVSTFSGSIKNNNQYPIVNGKLLVKIFKVKENNIEKNIYGPDVVDEFVVEDDISLAATSSKAISFTWSVPPHLESGYYKAVTFFIAADKFNLLGLSFTDDVVGNTAEFQVIGKTESVRFNKTQVQVNGTSYFFAAYPPRVDEKGPVKIKAELVNTTSRPQKVSVLWQVYSWDAQDKSNLIIEETTTVEVPANSKIKTEYTVTDTNHPVYLVRANSTYENTHSILNIRFVRGGVNKMRINFPAVTKYPLVKGQEAVLFSCLHSVAENISTPNGTLKLSLQDKSGNEFHSYTYSGQVTGMMMGVADKFVPEKDYVDFNLVAQLFDGDKLVDSATMEYSCKDIDPTNCKQTKLWPIVVLLVLCLIIGLLFKYKKMRIRKTFVVIIALISVYAVSPRAASAKDVQWNSTLGGGFVYYSDNTVNNTANGQPFWALGLVSPNITVSYSAQVTNADTGEVVVDGVNIPEGTRLNFVFSPHTSSDISWFGTGYSSDSPYGEWRANSTPPAVSCDAKDFVGTTTVGAPQFHYGVYIPVVIAPPTKQLINTSGLSCVDINATTKQCTVTGSGPMSPSFEFNTTLGKFYYRYYQGPYGVTQGLGCVGLNVAMDRVTSSTTHEIYSITVPTQTITYNFTGVANSQPPSNPIVSGPTTGYTNQAYTFSMVSTDPDNDQLRYGIDWANTGTVNEWVPGSGYVADETSQTTTNTWNSPGTYTFKVKAQDDTGADSAGWTTHTITISELDVCTNISSVQSAPLFEAHGRDYFYASGDGKLYFAPAGASSAAACTVDMCANTSAIEGAIPVGQSWNPSGADPYAQYSCNPPPTCSCNSTRTYSCTDGSSIPNAPQCALTAACTYTVSGDQVTFTYLATNVIGSLVNGQDNVQAIPANQAGVLSGTRTLSNTGDSQTAVAACGYTYDTTGLADPKILEFTSTPIVEKGGTCIFTWFTQDMTSCTLGGTDFGENGTRGFAATAGTNISKTLSCTSNETTPRQFVQTKTCLVKPTVIEQ